jgi:hypothetical protein
MAQVVGISWEADTTDQSPDIQSVIQQFIQQGSLTMVVSASEITGLPLHPTPSQQLSPESHSFYADSFFRFVIPIFAFLTSFWIFLLSFRTRRTMNKLRPANYETDREAFGKSDLAARQPSLVQSPVLGVESVVPLNPVTTAEIGTQTSDAIVQHIVSSLDRDQANAELSKMIDAAVQCSESTAVNTGVQCEEIDEDQLSLDEEEQDGALKTETTHNSCRPEDQKTPPDITESTAKANEQATSNEEDMEVTQVATPTSLVAPIAGPGDFNATEFPGSLIPTAGGISRRSRGPRPPAEPGQGVSRSSRKRRAIRQRAAAEEELASVVSGTTGEVEEE